MSTTNPTLNDLTSRMDAEGKVDTDIIEILNETNEMLEDISFVEATGVNTNTTTVRTGLPSVAWRKLNYGVQPSKSKTVQVTDTLGMLEARAEVDEKLIELNGNKESFRLTEDRAFIESMNQEFQRALLYGDISKDPEKIMGFMPRYSTCNRTKAANAINVIDAGGTGPNLTSILLVCWAPHTVHCAYPKGLAGGLKKEDLGRETLTDADGGKYMGLTTRYEWNVGLVVRDWRYVVRIANIDLDKLKADPDRAEDKGQDPGARLQDLMTDALELLPNRSSGRCAFYCSRIIRAFLGKQIKNGKNVYLSKEESTAKPVMRFDGVPIRRVDAMTEAEKRVI